MSLLFTSLVEPPSGKRHTSLSINTQVIRKTLCTVCTYIYSLYIASTQYWADERNHSTVVMQSVVTVLVTTIKSIIFTVTCTYQPSHTLQEHRCMTQKLQSSAQTVRGSVHAHTDTAHHTTGQVEALHPTSVAARQRPLRCGTCDHVTGCDIVGDRFHRIIFHK